MNNFLTLCINYKTYIMIKIEKMSDFDRITFVAVILLFVYWIVVKTPFFVFGFIYEATWSLGILGAFLSPIYFLIRWVIAKFSFKKVYFYALLISVLTFLVMTGVYKISSSGIEFLSQPFFGIDFWGN